ncbi:MAG TPA: hypothetical protein PKI15_04630 [Candidatus Cloacimonadota bacterium]|nr:hypothetical protein [Candidatus Cloacimonadota bacterium]
MKWSEVYTEILSRAGEGYDAYLSRATEMFWKAVSNIINTGEFDDNEVRYMVSRYTRTISREDFANGKYNLMRIWSDQAVPDENLTPFVTHEIFRYNVELTPVAPTFMKFNQVTMETLRSSHILASLSEATGIRSLIWSFDYPDITISTITAHQPFRCNATLSTYGIPRTAMQDADTSSDLYMSHNFLIRAIETAVKLLKTETE